MFFLVNVTSNTIVYCTTAVCFTRIYEPLWIPSQCDPNIMLQTPRDNNRLKPFFKERSGLSPFWLLQDQPVFPFR